MGELLGKARVTLNEHLRNIFKEKELEEVDVVRKSRDFRLFYQADQFIQS